MDGKSYDNVCARIAELKRLFPEAVKEGHFDPELLLGLLEENDETYGLNDERYDFTWKGKTKVLRLAQRRSDGTLRPCFKESRDWDMTQNLYIEGDNLEVMKLLQRGCLWSVKMIYIDLPYNAGNDFVHQDDFADFIAKYKKATGQGMRANPKTTGGGGVEGGAAATGFRVAGFYQNRGVDNRPDIGYTDIYTFVSINMQGKM
jgi:adenine-specific DNA-methyltransferase